MKGKRVLVVYAHPEPKSFSGAIKNVIVETLQKEGAIV
jgi:ribosyldihydronicotinamide dehydrogenase (quinone)